MKLARILVIPPAEADEDLVPPRPDSMVGRPAGEPAGLSVHHDVPDDLRGLSGRDRRRRPSNGQYKPQHSGAAHSHDSRHQHLRGPQRFSGTLNSTAAIVAARLAHGKVWHCASEPGYNRMEPIGERPMPEATLDQRMTAMEEAVRELQELMKARKPAPDWLDRVIGSMKDEPAFDEVLAYGRAIREADRPAEDQAP